MKRMWQLGVTAVTMATCVAVVFGAESGAGAVTPTPASTGTTTTSPATNAARLASIQALAKLAVSNRLASVNTTIPLVTANNEITGADRATLLATLNGDMTGLAALGPKIAADTTATSASADYQRIFTTYRVYALALPQVRYAAAVDDITTTVIPALNAAQRTLAGLLAGADASKNTAAVQASMTDLGRQSAATTSLTTGLAATVLADTPAEYDANHALLSQPRAALAQAGADVRSARADIASVLAALQ
jgi:hypothetical protein